MIGSTSVKCGYKLVVDFSKGEVAVFIKNTKNYTYPKGQLLS